MFNKFRLFFAAGKVGKMLNAIGSYFANAFHIFKFAFFSFKNSFGTTKPVRQCFCMHIPNIWHKCKGNLIEQVFRHWGTDL